MATDALSMNIDEYELSFPIKDPSDNSLIVKTMFDNKKQKHVYTINKHGELHGLYRLYVNRDILIMECNYKKGLKHGQSLEWNAANGVLMREQHFHYGLLHGTYKEYETNYITSNVDPDMVQHFLTIHCNYYMNRLHGPCVMRDIHGSGKQTIRYYHLGELCVLPNN